MSERSPKTMITAPVSKYVIEAFNRYEGRRLFIESVMSATGLQKTQVQSVITDMIKYPEYYKVPGLIEVIVRGNQWMLVPAGQVPGPSTDAPQSVADTIEDALQGRPTIPQPKLKQIAEAVGGPRFSDRTFEVLDHGYERGTGTDDPLRLILRDSAGDIWKAYRV
jgi:hypothetical protein